LRRITINAAFVRRPEPASATSMTIAPVLTLAVSRACGRSGVASQSVRLHPDVKSVVVSGFSRASFAEGKKIEM